MDVTWKGIRGSLDIIFKGKSLVSVAVSIFHRWGGRVWSRAEENAGHDLPCRRPKKDPMLG